MLGCYAGFRTRLISQRAGSVRDFEQVWYAARAILHAQNPYALIGPHLPFEWPAPLFYPLPAAVAMLPLAGFTGAWASTIFAGIGAAGFAWALMRFGYGPLFGFASAAVVFAVELAQWAPFLAAGIVAAPYAMFWVCKPTIGAALFVARPTCWAVVGAILFTALAFLLQPHWVTAWRQALHSTSSVRAVGFPYIAPVAMPGGVFALLALLRWRRPEARLLVAMACVPQTLLLYEAVPLFLIPRTLRETELLVFLSYVALATMSHSNSFAQNIDTSGRWIVLLLYLPCTLMVLRRPNVAHDVP